MKTSIAFLFSLILISCQKNAVEKSNCQQVIMWIDTYRQGKVVKTELSKDFGVVCDEWLVYYKSLPSIQPFCTDSTFLRIQIK